MSAVRELVKEKELKETKKGLSKIKSVKIKGYTPFKVHAGKGIP
jgi:hypothetical protein